MCWADAIRGGCSRARSPGLYAAVGRRGRYLLGLLEPGALRLSSAGTNAALVLWGRRLAAQRLTQDVLGLDAEQARVEAERLATSASPAFSSPGARARAAPPASGSSDRMRAPPGTVPAADAAPPRRP